MNIDELLERCTEEKLVEIVLSGSRRKKTNAGGEDTTGLGGMSGNKKAGTEIEETGADGRGGKESASKIKIRPVKIKGRIVFQAERFVGKQVLHDNLEKGKLNPYLINELNENFKQAQFKFTDGDGQVLCGSKGNMTVRFKGSEQLREQKNLTHNKQKRYILEEGKPVGFLVDLGVMTKEGKVVTSRYDKFKQINRFLEFIEDVLPTLQKDKDREQTIIDFGCGKSYLTFAIYYYLVEVKGLNIRIIGLDLKKDVIMHCNLLARKYGFEKLKFYVGDIADYRDVSSVDMVVTLHACDTATDYALEKAVRWGAKVILSVPCCQHEANAQIECDVFEPVLKYGILKERFSSILTDAIRAGRLEQAGYQTQLLEFIDMEHTPKNILIRAVKGEVQKGDAKKNDVPKCEVLKSETLKNEAQKNEAQKSGALDELERMFNLDLTISRML